MGFILGVTTVPPDLLDEVWLCAHLIALDRRRHDPTRESGSEARESRPARIRDCLGALSPDEWGQETVMACYQRASRDAASLDATSLRRACGFDEPPPDAPHRD